MVKTTYHMQWGVTLMYLVLNGHGEMMTLGNPLKEKDRWNGQYDLNAYEHNQLLETLVGFQKDVEAHGTHFEMASQVTALKAFMGE